MSKTGVVLLENALRKEADKLGYTFATEEDLTSCAYSWVERDNLVKSAKAILNPIIKDVANGKSKALIKIEDIEIIFNMYTGEDAKHELRRYLLEKYMPLLSEYAEKGEKLGLEGIVQSVVGTLFEREDLDYDDDVSNTLAEVIHEIYTGEVITTPVKA